MNQQPPQSDREPTEAEMRAALEEEMRRISVDDVLLQTVVSLINLAGRKAGLAPGSEGERDLEQVRLAIEGCRALLPLLEPRHADQLGAIRDALSQLQMAYAQMAGPGGAGPDEPGAPGAEIPGAGGSARPGAGGPAGPAPGPAQPGRPSPGGGPAQSSGRLWIPGQ